MNLHEFQAKEILRRFGALVPEGAVASHADEAIRIAEGMFASGAARVVVKSQIHAGGRGKGTFKNGFKGGVQVCGSAAEVRQCVPKMLGQCLVTKQTGEGGRVVRRLLVERASKILREYYLAVLLDRNCSRPIVIASTEGGMEIEEVAERSPEKILRVEVDPLVGLHPFQARGLAAQLGLKGDELVQASRLMLSLYRAFWESDATMVEINPLVLAEGGDGKRLVLALDAKFSLDDNALFRHADLLKMRDLEEEAPLEVEASQHGLNYIKLDGNIACMVNGAGLAMSTMDIIQQCGGSPANFLDVGGGATREQVTAAFRIILADPNVRGILVNIFGGIMKCDIIAEGVVAAARDVDLKLPVVVRLEGTNVELGRKILRESGLAVIPAASLAEAARKIVEATKKN